VSQPPYEPTPPLDPYAKPPTPDAAATQALSSPAPPAPAAPVHYQPPPYQPAAYPPPGYGGTPSGYGTAYPEASQATLALVFGIVGVTVFSILAPFAWWIGLKEKRAIDAGRRDPANRGQAVAGYILGIVGTVLLGIGLLVLIGYVIFFVLFFTGTIATSSSSLGAVLPGLTG